MLSWKTFGTLLPFGCRPATTIITSMYLMCLDMFKEFGFVIWIWHVRSNDIVMDHLFYGISRPKTSMRMSSTTILKFNSLKIVLYCAPFRQFFIFPDGIFHRA